MAILLILKTEAQLSTEIEAARTALKQLPPEEREGSMELGALENLQTLWDSGMFDRHYRGNVASYLKASYHFEDGQAYTLVKVFATQEARENNGIVTEQWRLPLPAHDVLNMHPLAFVYNYLKTLTGFEESEDA